MYLLLAASAGSWGWLIRKWLRGESPLPHEPRPLESWSWEALPRILGFDGDEFLSDVWLGLRAFVVAALPIYGLQLLLAYWFPYRHPVIDEFLKHRDWESLLEAATSAVLIAPVAEEMAFRVGLQGILEWLERLIRRRTGPTAGGIPPGVIPIAISSLTFALAHLGHGAAPFPLFFLALLLGYLYFQTHRIVPSIVVHMCLNAVSLGLIWCST